MNPDLSKYSKEVQDKYNKYLNMMGKDFADAYLDRESTEDDKNKVTLHSDIVDKLKTAKQNASKEMEQKRYGSEKLPPVLFKHYKEELGKIGKITDAQISRMMNQENIKTIWDETKYLKKLFAKQTLKRKYDTLGESNINQNQRKNMNLKQLIKEEVKRALLEAQSFQHLQSNYEITFSGPSISADGTIIKKGDKGGEYRVEHRGGRIYMINTKNPSDKDIFDTEKEMIRYLNDYTDPMGGRQSSRF